MQADADADPRPVLKLPAAQGVHAVDTAAAEKVDGGQREQSAADWLPVFVPTEPAPQGVQLAIPSRSAYDPAAQRVLTPPWHADPFGHGTAQSASPWVV